MLYKPIFGLTEIIFFYKLEQLEELINNTEKTLEIQLENFKEYVENNAKDLSEDEKLEFFDHISDEYIKYNETHPQIVRQSFFLQAYFSFEHFLNEVCTILKKRSNYKLDLKDIYGQGIEKAKIYISKVVNCPEPFDTVQWNKIRYYNLIRNIFVHNAGTIDINNKKHLTITKQIKNIKLNDIDEIILEKNFCIDVINTFREFTNILYSEINKQ